MTNALYNIYRARRLLAVLCAGTVFTVFQVYGAAHPWFEIALAVATLAPVAHAARYPAMWLEAICVALSVGAMLVAAQVGGLPEGGAALVVRLLVTGLVGFVVFMVTCACQVFFVEAGPQVAVTWRVSGRGRLPAPEMLRRLHLSEDPEWHVAPTEDADIFGLTLSVAVASVEDVAQDDPEGEEDGPEMFMKVLTDTERVYEYMTFERSDAPIAVTRIEVRPRGAGCVVHMAERATMSVVDCIGFWLSDYMGDYLTSRIDTAEQRAPRSPRGTVYNMLIVDIARLFPKPDEPTPPAPPTGRGPWG